MNNIPSASKDASGKFCGTTSIGSVIALGPARSGSGIADCLFPSTSIDSLSFFGRGLSLFDFFPLGRVL